MMQTQQGNVEKKRIFFRLGQYYLLFEGCYSLPRILEKVTYVKTLREKENFASVDYHRKLGIDLRFMKEFRARSQALPQNIKPMALTLRLNGEYGLQNYHIMDANDMFCVIRLAYLGWYTMYNSEKHICIYQFYLPVVGYYNKYYNKTFHFIQSFFIYATVSAQNNLFAM